MPKRTNTKASPRRAAQRAQLGRRAASPAQRAKRAEFAARELRARLEMASLRAAMKAQKAMLRDSGLATYEAAKSGRKNKDWRAAGISADAAIIPDDPVLNARSRQMVRDTWVATSAVSAFSRNVIGTGIIPVPQIKDAKDKLNVRVNKALMLEFWSWASDRRACDVEEDQTFWQMQTLAESERATVGEAFFIWSYEPNLTPDGRIDLRKPVGFKLQAFEPEQLDDNKLSHTDESGETREVRGGLELNERGVVVAYWIFTRNPNDYAFARHSLRSVRVPAERVLHYYRKRRVRQKRGVTDLAPVLQDMRDTSRHKEANLWRAIMEACIGVIVETDSGGGFGTTGGLPIGVPPAAGAATTTPSGMPTVDWTPGMVADMGPGKKLSAFTPQAPGGNYEPFQRQTLRGIGAGAGISYGQVSRDFTQGTYSGQRQEMLEDRKEFEPLQERFAHNVVIPIFKIFLALCALEGRCGISAEDYSASPQRYTNGIDYVAPPPTWIDPKAEAEALEKLVELRVITRDEITHMRGSRLTDVLEKIAAERDDAKAKGITFPEDAEEAGAADTAQGPDPELQRIKGEADAYGVGVRAGALTPQTADEEAFRTKLGLPPLSPEAKDAWDQDGGVRRPITLTLPEGTRAAPGTPPAAGGEDIGATDAGAQDAGASGSSDQLAALAAAAAADVPPNYRPGLADAPQSCGACKYFRNGSCAAFNSAAVEQDHTCDAWEAAPIIDDVTPGNRRMVAPPLRQDGHAPIDAGFAAKPDGQRRAALIEKPREYASTQVQLPETSGAALLALGQRIPDEQLAGDGRETDPHVTVKYGLDLDAPDEVKALLADEGPITIKLGKTSLFENGEFSVVKVDVASTDLHRLHNKLSSLSNADSHPTYVPHATVAYVKPEFAAQYSGLCDLDGHEFTVDRITFSGRDGTKSVIVLAGEPNP